MATNLISSVMQFLTPDMIAKIAPAFGIDAGVAQKVISAGVPAILASFTNLAAEPEGARQLSDALKQQGPNALSQVTNAIGGSGQKAVAETGAGLLSTLLGGGGVNALVAAVSNFSGINQTAGKSLLGLLGPVVMGTLGQQQRNSGLDANGLANLLSSQKDQITAAMPSGLGNMLGASGLLDAFDGSLRRGADTAAATAGRMAGASSNLAAGASDAAYAASRNAAASTWPYLLAGIAALFVIGWFLLGHHNPQVADVRQSTTSRMSEVVGNGAGSLTASDLSTDLASSVNTVRSTLQGITDPASARAALPKLNQATAQIDKINGLAAQLPPNARKGLASLLGSWMPVLNQLCDRALSSPEIAGVAKPTIEALRTKLELLLQA